VRGWLGFMPQDLVDGRNRHQLGINADGGVRCGQYLGKDPAFEAGVRPVS